MEGPQRELEGLGGGSVGGHSVMATVQFVRVFLNQNSCNGDIGIKRRMTVRLTSFINVEFQLALTDDDRCKGGNEDFYEDGHRKKDRLFPCMW